MVLTEEENQLIKLRVKSNSKLASLYRLRNSTKSYLIQCLADREIQKIVSRGYKKSKAYGYNNQVVHHPVKFFNVIETIYFDINIKKSHLVSMLDNICMRSWLGFAI